MRATKRLKDKLTYRRVWAQMTVEDELVGAGLKVPSEVVRFGC